MMAFNASFIIALNAALRVGALIALQLNDQNRT
ncbi:hypothetical protein SAMN06273570_0021 [Candidatus Pantoea floridensis]|uniref:Uncharacterized protein n=1 Tax=Candidatus Pantoea floridensis TaxID=1938870 RepID=A0A286BLB9_9GAMM|nr:hypothetical protein BX596_1698 [Enterobacteriaceae bacterium JKS000233]SOD34945.1 hypothetical protein SAMN06273570_0021 [Pantoea floridensis]